MVDVSGNHMSYRIWLPHVGLGQQKITVKRERCCSLQYPLLTISTLHGLPHSHLSIRYFVHLAFQSVAWLLRPACSLHRTSTVVRSIGLFCTTFLHSRINLFKFNQKTSLEGSANHSSVGSRFGLPNPSVFYRGLILFLFSNKYFSESHAMRSLSDTPQEVIEKKRVSGLRNNKWLLVFHSMFYECIASPVAASVQFPPNFFSILQIAADKHPFAKSTTEIRPIVTECLD